MPIYTFGIWDEIKYSRIKVYREILQSCLFVAKLVVVNTKFLEPTEMVICQDVSNLPKSPGFAIKPVCFPFVSAIKGKGFPPGMLNNATCYRGVDRDPARFAW